MDKQELLAQMRQRWAALDEALAGLDDAALSRPGAAGQWSAADVVARLSWAERETAEMLEARALTGSIELWLLDEDERNRRVYAQNRGRPPDEVLAEARQTQRDLEEAVLALDEAELHDPMGFTGWPPEWIPWQVIATNSYLHYDEHLPGLRALREG